MAFHLLDPGEEARLCSACNNDQGQGPFRECLIPRTSRAGGACTNCIFMGRGAACTHRIGLQSLSSIQ